jgi:hypothetical protein
MAMRDGGAQTLPSGRAAAGPDHVGRRPGLVDEHQAGEVEIELIVEPGLPPPQDVRTVLLGGVRGLFTVTPRRSKKRQRPP